MNFKKAIVAILYFMPLAIQAQWQQSILPLESYEDLYGISFVSNNEFFICSNTQISHTTNGGQSWGVTSLNEGFPFIPFIANTVYDLHFFNQNEGVATGAFNLTNDEVVIKSTNGGNHWDMVYLNSPFTPPAFFNALDVMGANVLVCGENGQILRSADSGNSFSSVNYSAGLELFDIKFLDANRAIAIGDKAVLRSNNGGANWAVDPAFAGAGVISIALAGAGIVYMSGASGLLKSIDEGVSFAAVPLPPVGEVGTLAASGDTIFASNVSGVFVSVNGGIYWQQFEGMQDKAINKMEIHNGKVYGLCDNKTLLTLNIATMQLAPIAYFTSNVDAQCGESILSATTAADTNALSLQWFLNGAFISTDQSFQSTYDTLPWYAQEIKLVVTDKSSFRTDTLIKSIPVEFRYKVVAEAGPDIYQCYGSKMILEVEKMSQYIEWLPHDDFDVEHEYYYGNTILTQQFFTDKQIVLKAWNDYDCFDYDTLVIHIGEPLEEQFSFTRTDFPGACSTADCVHITDLDFVSDSVGFGMTNNGVFLKSTDAGNTWSKLQVEGYNSDNKISGLDFIDGQTGYVGNPFSKTTDGGQTFTLMSVSGDDVSFINKDTGVVVFNRSPGTLTKFFKTTDGGQSFTTIYDETTDGTFIYAYDIEMVNANVIFAGGIGISSFNVKLVRSLDGGNSWEILPLPEGDPSVFEISAISADTLFYLSGRAIYRTYDAGQHWYAYYLFENIEGSYTGTIKMINKTIGYASTGREVYKTLNGGDCWTKVFTADWSQNLPYELSTTAGFSFPPSGRSMYFAASDQWAEGSPVVYYRRFYRERKGYLQERTCVGTPIRTHNQSFGYTHYQWYVNGVPNTIAYDADLFFNAPGDYIVKVVMDSVGLYPDSLSFDLHVLPLAGHLNAIEGPESVCTIQFDPNNPPLYPATYTITEHPQFPVLVWDINLGNTGVQEFPADSGKYYRLNFLFSSHESNTVFVYGIDTLGCHSDTVSQEVRTLNAVPADPTFFTITPCFVLDSTNIVNNVVIDSIQCSWGPVDDVDHYTLSFPWSESFETLSAAVPIYTACPGQYSISLTNDNVCGSSNPVERFYGVRYAELNTTHTQDTAVVPFSPAELRAEVSLGPLSQIFVCPQQIPVEWYFKNVFYGWATVLQFAAVTPADTGTYTVRFFNGCDTINIPIRLDFMWGVPTHEENQPWALQLSPNPNTGTFTIKLPEPASPGMTFRIVGLTGQMLQEQITEAGSSKQTVQASQLPAGLYFLQVVSEEKVLAVEKFVKQ